MSEAENVAIGGELFTIDRYSSQNSERIEDLQFGRGWKSFFGEAIQ